MKNILKWIGILAGALILIVVVYGGYIFMKAGDILNETYSVKTAKLYVPHDSATIARGEHLALSVATCAGCHGPDLGGVSIDMGPFAKFNVPNITTGKGGLPANYTVEQLDLAVRHGIKRDGKGTLLMPSYHLNHIANEDLAAVYAYLKAAPKVDREIPPFELGPIGKMVLFKGGIVNQAAATDHNFKCPPRPEIAPTAEYGKYIAEMMCIGCHSPNYSGGPAFEGNPNWPPSTNLTTKLKSYTHESFAHLLKTGFRTDGTLVDTTAMMVSLTSRVDSVEVAALWAYLSVLPKQADASSNWQDVLAKH